MKEKEDEDNRLKSQAKRLDYITRALRMEEMPVLHNKYNAQVRPRDRGGGGREENLHLAMRKGQGENEWEKVAGILRGDTGRMRYVNAERVADFGLFADEDVGAIFLAQQADSRGFSVAILYADGPLLLLQL